MRTHPELLDVIRDELNQYRQSNHAVHLMHANRLLQELLLQNSPLPDGRHGTVAQTAHGNRTDRHC